MGLSFVVERGGGVIQGKIKAIWVSTGKRFACNGDVWEADGGYIVKTGEQSVIAINSTHVVAVEVEGVPMEVRSEIKQIKT